MMTPNDVLDSTEPAVFHLAIPCRDLDEAASFYGVGLGCRLARRYEDRITMEFFGHQLVCHYCPDGIDTNPQLYPRHFGIFLATRSAFDALLVRWQRRGLELFEPPFVRFKGAPEEHITFFLIDPSNNVIEFKHCVDPGQMY